MKQFKQSYSTIQKCLLLVGGLIFVMGGLVACKPATEQERIDAINKRIAPEGYLTKTHLYINWPALKQDKEEFAKPLKLKIPLEYLVPSYVLDSNYTNNFLAYFEQDNLSPLFIQNKQIWTIYLTVNIDGTPYNPPTFFAHEDRKQAREKSKLVAQSIRMSIHRNEPHRFINIHSDSLSLKDNSHYLYGNLFREADLAGLERYVKTRCFDFNELENQVKLGLAQNELIRAKDMVASKASDDHSPDNCFENRGRQHLISPSVIPIEKQVSIECDPAVCEARFNLAGRDATIPLNRADGDSVAMYELKFSESDEYKKLAETAKSLNKEVYAFPQPRLNEVFTELQQWKKKVDTGRQLLNSFVIKNAD